MNLGVLDRNFSFTLSIIIVRDVFEDSLIIFSLTSILLEKHMCEGTLGWSIQSSGLLVLRNLFFLRSLFFVKTDYNLLDLLIFSTKKKKVEWNTS